MESRLNNPGRLAAAVISALCKVLVICIIAYPFI